MSDITGLVVTMAVVLMVAGVAVFAFLVGGALFIRSKRMRGR